MLDGPKNERGKFNAVKRVGEEREGERVSDPEYSSVLWSSLSWPEIVERGHTKQHRRNQRLTARRATAASVWYGMEYGIVINIIGLRFGVYGKLPLTARKTAMGVNGRCGCADPRCQLAHHDHDHDHNDDDDAAEEV